MIVIIGGAYQGKLDYVKDHYGIKDQEVYSCIIGNEIDLSKKVINGFHNLILAQIDSGIDILDYITSRLDMLADKIIVCDDISCGVVPIDARIRKWREACGRALALLSRNADEVIRVFCGIGTKLR